MERRSAMRCPVCQGAAVADSGMPEGVRCRRSICAHNHSEVRCPRCQRQDLDSVDFKDGSYHYTCRECLNRWAVAEAG